eukprot:6172411-Pleurochrysis_carterae.AAC.3
MRGHAVFINLSVFSRPSWEDAFLLRARCKVAAFGGEGVQVAEGATGRERAKSAGRGSIPLSEAESVRQR